MIPDNAAATGSLTRYGHNSQLPITQPNSQ